MIKQYKRVLFSFFLLHGLQNSSPCSQKNEKYISGNPQLIWPYVYLYIHSFGSNASNKFFGAAIRGQVNQEKEEVRPHALCYHFKKKQSNQQASCNSNLFE